MATDILTNQPNSSKTTNGNIPHRPGLTAESAAYLIQYALDNLDYPATPNDHRAIQLGAMAASHLLTGQPDASAFDPAELEQALARLTTLSNRPAPTPEPKPEPPAPDSPIRTPAPTPDDLTGLTGYDIVALALNGLQDHIDGCMAFGEAVPTDLADNHPLRHKLAVLLDKAISCTDSPAESPACCPICQSETIHADWTQCHQEHLERTARVVNLEMDIDLGYATFRFNGPQLAGLVTALHLAENATETPGDEACNSQFRTFALMFESALMAMTYVGYMEPGEDEKTVAGEIESLLAKFINSRNNVI